MHTLLRWLIFIFLVTLCILIILRFFLMQETRSKIRSQKEIPSVYHTIIVFGAGVNSNNLPTKVLRDRLDKTIQLLEQHKEYVVLLSGGKTTRHDEVQVMNTYLIKHGISPEILMLDDSGISTFDTLKRAREVFNIHAAILVTQQFHLPRAIAIAQHFELDVIGIPADTKTFRKTSLLWWNFRELFAWVWTFTKL